MTELETQLLRIIEEQQQQLMQQQVQLQKQQQALDTMQTKIIQALSAQSKTQSDQQAYSKHRNLSDMQKQGFRATGEYRQKYNNELKNTRNTYERYRTTSRLSETA